MEWESRNNKYEELSPVLPVVDFGERGLLWCLFSARMRSRNCTSLDVQAVLYIQTV